MGLRSAILVGSRAGMFSPLTDGNLTEE